MHTITTSRSTTDLITVDNHTIAVTPLNPGAVGEPTILIHGISASNAFWGEDQTELFREMGPCYAVGLPGHYPGSFAAGFQPESLTAELIADLLASAIRQVIGNRPATLVGMSTGGFAALAVAALYPELAARVISVSGFAQGRWTGALGAFQRLLRLGAIGRLLFKPGYSWPRLDPSIFRASWSVYPADSRAMYSYPPMSAMLHENYYNFARLDYDQVAHYFARMPNLDITPLLPQIRVPTLALAGDADPTVPPTQALLIAESIPGADLVIIPDAGHALFAERSEQYQQALRQWLAKTASR